MSAPNLLYRDHFFRVLFWILATSPIWIAGAAVSPETRLLWWGLAAGIDQIGTWLAHPIPGRRLHSEHVWFPSGHMVERCRLFLIIALGETIIETGIAIAEAPTTLMSVVTGTMALVGTIAMWVLAFGRVGRLLLEFLEETQDPIRASRHAMNALLVMVAGLIAVAVANEEIIAHPHEHVSVILNVMLYGGPMLLLLGLGWYLWFVPQIWPRLHLIGSAVLLVIGFAALAAPSYIALILVGGILSVLAVLDQR